MKRVLFTIAIITFAAIVACNNNPDSNANPPTAPEGAKLLSYEIGPSYPHDTSSFTEGLLIYKDHMYESTGIEGKSKLMEIDIATGKPKRSINLDPKYFGEGISIVRDTIYQLTYTTNDVLVYTLKDFKKIDKQFSIKTQGWGMTTDGKELIATDGTSNLYYYNPTDFRLLRTQAVTEGGNLAFNLNELEYIDGFIYANQWQQPYIFKIDPSSGNIVGKLDLADVWNRVKARDPHVDVPNGIAYDSTTKKIYITGKNWPELFELKNIR